VNNVYSKSDYMSSFVGFFPSRRPAVTILVVVDAPQKGVYYGGTVAAPIFQRIADAASRHLALAPTVDPQPPVLISRPDRGAAVRVSAPDTRPDIVRTGGRPDLLPDLRGLSARQAVRVLARIGIHARVSGVGRVAEQTPDAGSALDDVVECELRLKREPPADPVEETVEISRDDR
jgi:cell division protein FtsI (penicillin-binding protein 3)